MTTFKTGASGDDVKTLQAALRSLGFYKPPAAIDGEFGSTTDAAVREFQRARGLEVDGIVGDATWTAVLDPNNKIIAKAWPPAVAQWSPWLMRCQIVTDPLPIERALKWIQIESGGNPCATGRIVGEHVMEAGLAQSYFETPTSTVAGYTSAQLRALCACEGTTQHGAPCTDAAMLGHASTAMTDIRAHRARARAKLAAAGLTVDETTPEWWAWVKTVHALPGLYSYLRPAMLAVGNLLDWHSFKAWVLSASESKLRAIDPGTARYYGEFARCFKNADDFAGI